MSFFGWDGLSPTEIHQGLVEVDKEFSTSLSIVKKRIAELH